MDGPQQMLDIKERETGGRRSDGKEEESSAKRGMDAVPCSALIPGKYALAWPS